MRTKKLDIHGARTKEEIIKEIEGMVEVIRAGEGDEGKKTVKSHMAYLDFAESFLYRVKNIYLPELTSKGWEYSAEITEEAALLMLQYVRYTEDDEEVTEKYVGKVYGEGYICIIYQTFFLIDMEPRMLTVEDYAQLHDVNVGTVRQWIRRGKIRRAQKIGNEWRIPEFVEPIKGNYPDGIFVWGDEFLQDLPDKYSWFNEYDELGITQIDADTYKVGLERMEPGNEDRKILMLNTKEREKLELYLISNPFVKCIDGRLNFEAFENDMKESNDNE